MSSCWKARIRPHRFADQPNIVLGNMFYSSIGKWVRLPAWARFFLDTVAATANLAARSRFVFMPRRNVSFLSGSPDGLRNSCYTRSPASSPSRRN